MSSNNEKGAAIYSPLVLRIYDGWVLGFSNRYAWNCSTKKVLLPFFMRHVGQCHMDVGVGTGFYPANANLAAPARITLVDLNVSSLQAARNRLSHLNPNVLHHDVMTPFPDHFKEEFDSISLFYLLHCVSGTMREKSSVFAHLKTRLKKSGVLYGATILGDEAGHNGLGRMLMNVYNRKGIFCNRLDSLHGLQEGLRQHFEDVTVRVEGKVALFEARVPIF